MDRWTLAIDFGTCATAVAVRLPDKAPTLVNFGTSSAMPSAILTEPDGTLVTGQLAVNQRRRYPERFEAYPKRHLGETNWFLGRPVDPVEAIGAVLRAAAAAASRQFNGSAPDAVVLTHPAGWEHVKLEQFRRAAAAAGLGSAQFVPEPQTAAMFYAAESGKMPSGPVAVYDLGGGTFDAAVVDAADGRFDVRRNGGLDWVGGVAFDFKLLELVGARLAESHPQAWASLSNPRTPADFQARLLLADDVKSAKEALTDQQQTSIFIPLIDGDVLVTRREFDDAIRREVDASVDQFERTVTEAGLTVAQLAAVYLVGGSSAVPLVSDTIFRRFGRKPSTRHDPKAVVALGATLWPDAEDGGTRVHRITSGVVKMPRKDLTPSAPRPGAPNSVTPQSVSPLVAPPPVGPPVPLPPPVVPVSPAVPYIPPPINQPAQMYVPPPQPAVMPAPEPDFGPPTITDWAAPPILPQDWAAAPMPRQDWAPPPPDWGQPPGPDWRQQPYPGPPPAPNRNMQYALLAGAAVVALVIAFLVFNSHDKPSAGPTRTSSSVPKPGPDSSTPPDNADWDVFSDFSDLIGSSPGDTSSAWNRAKCSLDPATSTHAPGADKGVACTGGSGPSFAVYHFPDTSDLDNLLSQLQSKGFSASPWDKGGATLGQTLTVEGTSGSEIVTTFDSLAEFVVDMQSTGSLSALESQWNDAPLPG